MPAWWTIFRIMGPKLAMVEPLFSHVRQNNVQIKQEIHSSSTSHLLLCWYSFLMINPILTSNKIQSWFVNVRHWKSLDTEHSAHIIEKPQIFPWKFQLHLNYFHFCLSTLKEINSVPDLTSAVTILCFSNVEPQVLPSACFDN